MLHTRSLQCITRKMVPITRLASSFLVFFFVYMYVRFQKQNRKEKEEEEEEEEET